MLAYVPVVFAVLGAVLYLLSKEPKAAELGRITFAAGMFAALFAFGSHLVKLFA